MKSLTATILIALLTALPVLAADKTEDKLQANLTQRIERLNAALKRFKEFKKAYAKAPSKDRETTLRLLCGRLQRETKSINNAIATMDMYLEIKSLTRGDVEERDSSQDRISSNKNVIKSNAASGGQLAKN